MDRQRLIVLPKYCSLLFVMGLPIMMSLVHPVTQAQVVSPELRRLSVATNQFGIDTLRALDRIEPPDKVLVFCPACVSSSLMMIMMGSSKYQVVSSLRHALYVWALKPQEINRGFKDIFEHIGINQLGSSPYRILDTHQPDAATGTRTLATYSNSSRASGHFPLENDETRLRPVRSVDQIVGRSLGLWPASLSDQRAAVSLPALIKLKELMERSHEAERPWWHTISRRSQDKRKVAEHRATSEPAASELSIKEHRLAQNESLEASQMSALSNIYIQRGLTINYNYNLMLRQSYKTVIHPVDFLRNSEETRLHINSLVASNTENKIKDLVKKSTFEAQVAPKIMVISTFHFRGTLDIKMTKTRKKQKSTTLSARRRRSQRSERLAPDAGTKKESKGSQFIETESTPLKYGHFSSLGCSVIEIPFDNRLVTLIVVMPDDRNSTDLLLTRLSAQVLSDMVNSLVVKRLSLGIPVIKFDRGPINMAGLLKELGLDNLFFGDRAHSTETGLNRWLRPTDIVHETSIDIGTMNPDWAQPEDRLKLGAHDSRTLDANHIKLDKPFFYFVMDSINSLILTMGRIRQ